ncbi:PEGA domain-containing protein [Candidatus Saccharibacteria bacterium]|nr:MAG: PEGA domain-containing protein [Candidatus Saccharibacteria bacterium]
MDFLDPRKERLNRIVLIASYGLIAVAIALTSWMLLYQTDGYCLGRDGKVDRCGLVFVSSQPDGATVHIDDKVQKFTTNGKVNLKSGTYNIRLSRSGYHDWSRSVTVAGGDVQRFDYPLLYPVNLKSKSIATLGSSASFVTQSPNRRWVVVAEIAQPAQLKVFDLRNSEQPSSVTIQLPTTVISSSESVQSWNVVEWSSDGRHILTQRSYTAAGTQAQEYLLLDRQDGTAARNITKELSLAPAEQVRLFDKKQNLFYVYNTETKVLRTLALNGSPPATLQLQRVLAYKTYEDNTILYVTDTPLGSQATPGFVWVVLQQGTRSGVLKRLPTASRYLLDIAQYDGKWYVVLGSDASKGVYTYLNPLDAVLAKASDMPAPFRFLKLPSPQYVSFSANAQFILVGNGLRHTVYDLEYQAVYHYIKTAPFDASQAQAVWMDGHRLTYISDGKVVAYDYDNLNEHVLHAALPQYGVFFAPDFEHSYAVTQVAGELPKLTQTALIVP